jgi:hypothetical protein
MALKLLLLAPSKDTLAALPRQLPPGGDEVETFTVVGGASQLVAEVERARPDLVVGEVR